MRMAAVSGVFTDLSDDARRIADCLRGVPSTPVLLVGTDGSGFTITFPPAVGSDLAKRAQGVLTSGRRFREGAGWLIYNAQGVDIPPSAARFGPLFEEVIIGIRTFAEWVSLSSATNLAESIETIGRSWHDALALISSRVMDLEECLGRASAATGLSPNDLDRLADAVDSFDGHTDRIVSKIFFSHEPPGDDLLRGWVTSHRSLVGEASRFSYFVMPKLNASEEVTAAASALCSLLKAKVVEPDFAWLSDSRVTSTAIITQQVRNRVHYHTDLKGVVDQLVRSFDQLFAAVEQTFAASSRYYTNRFVRPTIARGKGIVPILMLAMGAALYAGVIAIRKEKQLG